VLSEHRSACGGWLSQLTISKQQQINKQARNDGSEVAAA